MNHLLRELAPISDQGWQMLEAEAKQRLAPPLAARRLVDFSGPHGWQHSATNLGRVAHHQSSPWDGVSGLQRRVLPLAELRADFELARSELRDGDRGADDVDLSPLDTAAHQIAVAENLAVLDGWKGAMTGISEVSPHDPIPLNEMPDGYLSATAGAVERLLESGVAGPYGMAVCTEHYRLIAQATEHGGYPLAKHLHRILGGPLAWAPGIAGAVVISQRGGDFVLDSGQDIALGYDSHDADTVRLYLLESFSFHVATPEAAVVLTG